MTKTRKPDTGVISLADEQAVRDAVWTSIQELWEVVNTLTRLRPSTRDRYRVTIFGSARVQPDTFAYDETKRAARKLAEMGCDIITGGGPGLMQAANEGASAASGRSRSYGIRVELPFEQDVNAFVTQAFEHQTFFTRLHQFVLVSDAFIVTPGGIGTVLETMLIWQLLQVRHLQDTPLILVGTMWPGPDRVGAVIDAGGSASAGQSRGHEDPGVRRQRRSGHRAHPEAPQRVAGGPDAPDSARGVPRAIDRVAVAIPAGLCRNVAATLGVEPGTRLAVEVDGRARS